MRVVHRHLDERSMSRPDARYPGGPSYCQLNSTVDTATFIKRKRRLATMARRRSPSLILPERGRVGTSRLSESPASSLRDVSYPTSRATDPAPRRTPFAPTSAPDPHPWT